MNVKLQAERGNILLIFFYLGVSQQTRKIAVCSSSFTRSEDSAGLRAHDYFKSTTSAPPLLVPLKRELGEKERNQAHGLKCCAPIAPRCPFSLRSSNPEGPHPPMRSL